ncbi:hypothetical protein, partial [Schleiferia thermophila]
SYPPPPWRIPTAEASPIPRPKQYTHHTLPKFAKHKIHSSTSTTNANYLTQNNPIKRTPHHHPGYLPHTFFWKDFRIPSKNHRILKSLKRILSDNPCTTSPNQSIQQKTAEKSI